MILRNWGVAEKSIQTVITVFNDYIRSRKDPFPDQHLSCGDYIWDEIQERDIIWRYLGEVALRLHCSPCSEASCERTISTQRLLYTARRISSKKQLIDARLKIMRGLD